MSLRRALILGHRICLFTTSLSGGTIRMDGSVIKPFFRR
jgi:hypothetical protein